ncbi:MAG TPA: iron ABC transporter permease [Cellulomonas sp.]
MTAEAHAPVRRGEAGGPARLAVVATGAVLALVVALAASIGIGAYSATPVEIVRALTGSVPGELRDVLLTLRIPRTVLAVLTGAALAAAGALMQGLTRNPLADPGILGVNAGAGLAVAVAVGGLGITAPAALVPFAAVGALLATLVVHAIGAAARGPLDPSRLVLGGVAVGAVLSGISSMLVLLDPRAFDAMRSWVVGSVSVDGWHRVLPAVPVVLGGLVLALAVARGLDSIAMGDDLAAALGVHLGRVRALTVIAITALCAASVAASGPIGFVGLMAPHVVRLLVGGGYRRVLLFSLLVGPVIVLVADVVGRLVVQPAEMPAGIVTAFVGAIALAVLIRRDRRA